MIERVCCPQGIDLNFRLGSLNSERQEVFVQFQDPHRLGSMISGAADIAKAKKRRNESLKKKFLRGLLHQLKMVFFMLSPFLLIAILIFIFK